MKRKIGFIGLGAMGRSHGQKLDQSRDIPLRCMT